MRGFVKLPVQYYNPNERADIAKQRYFANIDAVADTTRTIGASEFIGNGLLREQKDQPGWRNRAELSKKILSRWRVLRDYFSIKDGRLNAIFRSQHESDKAMTETIGVAATISVVDDAFGTHQADWQRIVIGNSKDLDFQVSTAEQAIFVEAKGRLVEDPTARTGLSSAKADIKDKKSAKKPTIAKSRNAEAALIGVIVAISDDWRRDCRCYLVDPPIDMPINDPRKSRLLSRLHFYRDHLRMFSKSSLIQSLNQRIQDIASSDNYESLSGRALVGISDEPMKFPQSFLETLSHNGRYEFFGDVIDLSGEGLFFFGLVDEVVTLLINQNFNEILSYNANTLLSEMREVTFTARIKVKMLEKYDIAFSPRDIDPHSKRVAIDVKGEIGATRSGFVFGELEAK